MKRILLLLVLGLVLLGNVTTAMAVKVDIMDGTAISYAKEDHLAYGIVKIYNNEEKQIDVTLSITPDSNHRIDDNLRWGNYKDTEHITLGVNELRVQVFCITVPAGSELGKNTWTVNVSVGAETVVKKLAINLPVTKNVQINPPACQPEILKLGFPAGEPDTIVIEANQPKTIITVLKIAGDLSSPKTYDVEVEGSVPDVFFSYPKKITVTMSKPKKWDFDNQEFLPFTVIPGIIFTTNVPYSKQGNMYEVKMCLEEKNTGLETSLPFQLVITPPEETAIVTMPAKEVAGNETLEEAETVSGSDIAIDTDLTDTDTSEEIVATSIKEVTAEKPDNKKETTGLRSLATGTVFLLCALLCSYTKRNKS